MTDDRMREKIENSKALTKDISTTLAEAEAILLRMKAYLAATKVDRTLDLSPMDASYEVLLVQQQAIRRQLVRLMINLQAAHRLAYPRDTKGRSVVDIAEQIAKEQWK